MSAPPRPLTVLVVEDKTINRALVRAILARSHEPALRDCVLLEASSLSAARATLAAHAVDVVLLDVRLPDGDGLDLAREMRASPQARPAIVIVSASVLPAERAAALHAGGDAFVSKPFDTAELVLTISTLVAAKRG